MVIADQHIKIPPNSKRVWRAMYRHDNTARQSSVFLFGGLSKLERKNKPVIRKKSYGFIGSASVRLAFRRRLFLNPLQQSRFPACILDSRGDNSAAMYLPGFCFVFYHRRRDIISTFQFPLAYLLKIEILYPIERDYTSFYEKQNLHIIDVSILNT